MAKDREPKNRDQSVGHVWANWRNSDLPFVKKCGVFMKNELRKAARLKTCCGNHAEPGC